MIAYLKGIVAHKSPDTVVIDVHGVGYQAEIPTTTYEQLPKEGKETKLLIHFHVTDNDQRLFGFSTEEEKELFELLTTVKGVGPKLGLTILSGMPAAQIIAAISHSDKGALSQISGIGKKTAERMILELKDKITDLAVESSFAPAGTSVSGNLKEEAVSALQSLGFRKKDAEEAVSTAVRKGNGFDGNVQELVKKALSHLNK